MLRKLVENQQKAWHRFLPALLYACRDVPNCSTGFSPFELLFGRRPRGPLDLVAQAWTGRMNTEDKVSCKYIFELQNFFEEASKTVKMNLEDAERTNKKYRDRNARERKFKKGDEVLLLLPDDTSKLLMGWKGPYTIMEEKNNNYILEIDGKKKVVHANLLKKFFRRNADSLQTSTGQKEQNEALETTEELLQQTVAKEIGNHEIVGNEFVPNEHQVGYIASVLAPDEDDEEISVKTLSRTEETLSDAKLDENLNEKMKTEMRQVLEKTRNVYKTEPGQYKGDIEHNINLTSNVPTHKRQYPLPFSSQEILKREVDYMESIGVIEKANSPYSAPVVLVSKPDGSTRVCVDYRDLNKITVFDAEPIPDIEELFTKLAGKRYFTKVDLSKGYWQIPVKKEDRPKTAFQTPKGLYQWVRMPFGLVSAPATFERMMRQLELERFSGLNFFDDILIASASWEQHLADVEGMIKCIHENGLTIRPSKIYAGFQELEFLGHMVGKGKMRPEKSKIDKILNVPKPKTKKQVRALMGLLGYYRKYIPGYSIKTTPITDQLKGDKKSIEWTDECEAALEEIQKMMSQKPVLVLPDLGKKFTVRTDASGSGIGGVLLQEFNGTLHPVSYVSRKLLDRETRYSTIERECLAIVWTLQKLGRYLWGQKFVLQTDHKPLTFINTAIYKNNRILKWSLVLQTYKFEVKEIRGCDNVFADLLSRSGKNQELP